jgi:PAS domain S-box-containing protein
MPDAFPPDLPTASVTPSPVNWSTQQLTGFLAVVSSAGDEQTATRLAVERAAEALDAEVAALVRMGKVVASIGLTAGPGSDNSLLEVVKNRATTMVVPGVGDCPALAIPVEDDAPASIVLARHGAGGFAVDELHLARGMARVLGLSLRLFRLAAEERGQRHEAETQSELNQRLLESLQERQELLERLSRIQRSIAHGAGRRELLEAIVNGAAELLGDDVAAVRLLTPEDPGMHELVASTGVPPDVLQREGPMPLDTGMAGEAIAEGRLVVTEDYATADTGLPLYKSEGVQAGMAAPVYEGDAVVGALVVASYHPKRRYSATERDMLLAFADHASLALTDTTRIQNLRDRDAARAQARFRSLVQSSSDLITVIDPDGTILYVSPSVERTVDAPSGGLTGIRLAELIHADDRSATLAFLAKVARDESRAGPVEWRMRAREGGWLAVETIATGLLDDPDVQGVVLNSRDVTERKRLEAQLRQSQRLESVGQLAGGIAHDFNNFLSVIRGYARFVIDGLPEDSPQRADAEEIANAAERATRLTNQLLVFSRREVVRSSVLDLSQVLGEIGSLLDRTLGEDVELRTRAADGLWRVEADPSQLEQVLVNLAVNARDAMPGGGTLCIALANASFDVGEARAHADLQPGRYVRLTVTDTGRGMSPDVVERAMEPFYTTKPKGQGTGLGLATVYGIVTHAGGAVEIVSAPGEGTKVEVFLPATEADALALAPSEDESAPQAAGETILVVEDEDAVRRLTCRILARRGYEVVEASDGPSALQAWEHHDGHIDLLLTDVVMPGMSGKELAERLAERQPGLEPVFMSGYTDDVVLRHGVEGEEQQLVQKPFDAETLLAAIRTALDAGRA